MTSGLLTVPIFLIFQNNTPLIQLVLIELKLAFGMIFTEIF